MSKTLFNTNTFQSKNVRNSDDVGTLKVDTFKATNAILTNITNAELQAATSGVATNASAISTNATNISNNTTAIAGKEDAFVVSEFNPLKKDTTDTPYLLYVATDTSPTLGSNDVVTSGGLYQYLIDNYNAKLTNGSSLQLSIDDTGSGINVNDEISVILATTASATDYGLVTGNLLYSGLSSKQDTLSAGDGIRITASNEVSLDGTRTGNFLITGNFESDGTDFKMWNNTRGGAGTSNGRALVHQGTGTKASSILRINYNADYGGGTQIDSIVGIKTAPNSSYDLNVNGNTNIGGILSIDGYSNVKTALDTATGGTTYTAQTNGGLAVNVSNEFYIDLTNTNADFEIPQNVLIEKDTTDAQLTIRPVSINGQDAILKIIGHRNGTTTVRQAQLKLQNYDSDNGGFTNELVEIAGVVTNNTTNIGGLEIANYADGTTRTVAASMNENGNFHLGTGFQNNYKLQVTGNTNFTGDSIIGGTLQIAGISNVRTAIEGKQDTLTAASGGGLSIISNEIAIDFTNTAANIEIPQRVTIENDVTAQLIVTAATSGNDAAITIRGERASIVNRQAQLRFENTLSGTTNDLAEIAGVVTNALSNIGGLGIYNFADGSTRTAALLMNNNGRFHLGTTFQDTYKLQVTGNCNFTGDTNVGGDLNLTGLLVCDNSPVDATVNRIVLYDAPGGGADYGFGINSFTLTYHTATNHRFVYGSTTSSGGTVGMELSSSNLDVKGNTYIKQGLILDPYNMGTTTFTTGNDNQASATSRENIYIKFAPSSTVANDWAYLRNIGANNQGHLALDFHDDNDDVRFSIRNIRSSSVNPDVITNVFDVYSSGVTAHTAVYRIPQMAFYNFNKTAVSNNLFGNGNRFITTTSVRTTGSSFSSHSNGNITISANGYYRIKVGANPVTDAYADRLAFAVYLLIGSTDYFQNENYNFHGYTYTRNNTDGAFGNLNFEDYVYIASGTAIQVRTKLDTDGRTFDNTLTNAQMECYCNLQIERIAETDIT